MGISRTEVKEFSCYNDGMSEKKNKRDLTVDLLRVLGIALVMLAHCDLRSIVNEIREFDVILLVFVSGFSFGLSSFQLNKENYLNYVRKRVKRLVLPVWLFLLVFYPVFYFFFHLDMPWNRMLLSFLFLSGGIGFVWVYRVFFINALITPFFKKICSEKPFWRTAGLLYLLLVINELFYVFVLAGKQALLFRALVYLVTYNVSYAVAALFGMLETRTGRKEKTVLGVLFLLAALSLHQWFGMKFLHDFKYPPRLYYVSYGLGCTNLLYVIVSLIPFSEKGRGVVSWLSEHAMNLYLWHIVIYYLIELGILFQGAHGYERWFIMLGGSVITEVIVSGICSLLGNHHHCEKQ